MAMIKKYFFYFIIFNIITFSILFIYGALPGSIYYINTTIWSSDYNMVYKLVIAYVTISLAIITMSISTVLIYKIIVLVLAILSKNKDSNIIDVHS